MLFNPMWQNDPVARVLLYAADQLETVGWCQGTEMDRQGRMCAVGAIRRACRDRGEEVFGMLSHLAIVRVCTVVDEVSVPSWNDREGRTRDDVTTALRRAAWHPVSYENDPSVRALCAEKTSSTMTPVS